MAETQKETSLKTQEIRFQKDRRLSDQNQFNNNAIPSRISFNRSLCKAEYLFQRDSRPLDSKWYPHFC